jgi:hypothetical protein
MIQPWMHAPAAHQQAFTAQFGNAPSTPFIPAAESGNAAGAFIPNAVQAPAIHEQTKPKKIRGQVHSGIKAVGLGGATQSAPMPSGGTSNVVQSGTTSLGNL